MTTKNAQQGAQQRYVLGFVFRDNYTSVVLIRKSKPKWQAGLLNGVVGKIENEETPDAAMTREFKKETGVEVLSWRRVGEMRGEDWIVCIFSCADSDAWEKATTIEGEEVIKVHPDELGDYDCVSNLHWLVEMAIDENYGKDFYALINYSKPFTFQQALDSETAGLKREVEQLQGEVLKAGSWLVENSDLKNENLKLKVALHIIANIKGNPPIQVARKMATKALEALSTTPQTKE